MALWQLPQRRKAPGNVWSLTGELFSSLGQSRLLQWGIACLVGLLLGIYVLVIAALPQRWMLLLGLALLGPLVLLSIGQVRRPLLAIIILDIALQLDVHLYYQEEVVSRGALGGFNLSVTTLCLAALYALWCSEVLARQRTLPNLLGRMLLPLALYLLFVILSVLAATSLFFAAVEIALLFQMFLLYLYLVGTVNTKEDLQFIVIMLLLSVAFQSASMIAVYLTRQDIVIAGLSTEVDKVYTEGVYRPGGFIGSPIDAASYLGLLLAPTCSLLFTSWSRPIKWLAMLSLSLGTVALVLTLSRAGWGVFFLSSALLCFFVWRRGWLPVWLPALLGVVLLCLAILLQEAIITRLTGDDGGSARSRIHLTRLALEIIRDHPWVGVGANNYAIVVTRYLTPDFSREWIYVVHNKYLLVWAETGIGGLLAFLGFLVTTLWRGWRCWQRHDRFLSPLALGFTAALAGHMLHMLVDVFHSRPQVQLLWLIAGLIAAMRYNLGEQPQCR